MIFGQRKILEQFEAAGTLVYQTGGARSDGQDGFGAGRDLSPARVFDNTEIQGQRISDGANIFHIFLSWHLECKDKDRMVLTNAGGW